MNDSNRLIGMIRMIILKHAEYKVKNLRELERLLNHFRETTPKVNGVKFKDICKVV